MTGGSEITPKDLKLLRKKCDRYEKSCQKLHKEVEELKQEANKLKEEKQKEHEDNLKEQKQRNEEHAEEMQTLHDRIKTDEELQKRLEKTQGDIQQYKDQIESLRNRNSEFTVSCEQKDSTIEQLRCDVCEKDCRIKTIQNTLQETDEILKKTLEGMEWYENDIIKYNLEVDRVNDLNAILYEENTQMKHKVEHYQVNVVEYKNSCRDMERKDQACMEQISKLETQVTQLKAKIYDKENNTKDIAQTFHTYENILRDKDEENGVQMEVIKERDITIDDLTRQIKEFNEQIPELNKQILEEREEMELLRHIVNERDQELHQERSLLTEYSEKYNYAIETVEHYSSQLTTCFNETSALQQHVATQESLQHEKERELLQLTTELQVVGQTMKELELKNGLINDEMLKWKKGHSFLQDLRENHELLLKRRENELQELNHSLQEKEMKVTQMHSKIKSVSDDLSSCQDQNVNFRNTLSELRESCDEKAMKINELEMINENRDGTIMSQRNEYTALQEGHIRFLHSHERLSHQCETYTQTIRELEEKLKQAQEELNKDKEAYTFCTRFQQHIHASILRRENEENMSFRTRLPGEECIEMLEKQVRELKDYVATVTLEAYNRQISVREKNDEIKQLRTQLYGYKDRVFELQRLQAESRLTNGD